MWVFTKYGFYSAVCARQGNGAHGQPVDLDRIMVRARVREHLDALIDAYPDLLTDAEIKTFPGTDYAYRLFLPKEVWTTLLSWLGNDIDYDNFKGEVGRFQGQVGADYEHALHDVWGIMYKIQK